MLISALMAYHYREYALISAYAILWQIYYELMIIYADLPITIRYTTIATREESDLHASTTSVSSSLLFCHFSFFLTYAMRADLQDADANNLLKYIQWPVRKQITSALLNTLFAAVTS